MLPKNTQKKTMPTLTVSIPEELKKKMDQYPEINWPEVIKTRLRKRAEALLAFEQKRQQGET
jgi:hypothetical protein